MVILPLSPIFTVMLFLESSLCITDDLLVIRALGPLTFHTEVECLEHLSASFQTPFTYVDVSVVPRLQIAFLCQAFTTMIGSQTNHPCKCIRMPRSVLSSLESPEDITL
jgi:hypothetical protein